MATVLTFDSLNRLDHENRRSEDYDEYFSGMGLTDEQKKERISLAEDFERVFWPVLVYLYSLLPFGLLDADTAYEQFLEAFISVVVTADIMDIYLEDYAHKFADEVAKSTLDHTDDPYYFSLDRAMYLSENESESAYSHDEFEQALLSGKRHKRWVDMRDNRVRETHRKVHGSEIPIQEPFLVGDSLLMYPKDTSLGASPEEIVNCRCTVQYF